MKQQLVLALFAVCFAFNALAQSSSWAVIHNNFETIAMANSFYADNNGFVAGGTASGQPLLLLSNDGGQTFTNQNLLGNNHAAFLSIDMYDSQNGVAGALGFMGLFACGAYTHDGHNWNATHGDLVCALQDCQAIDQNNFVMVGAWSNRQSFQGNGVIISTDGGNTWQENSWNIATEARYAWFESADYGYVAGGSWPAYKQSNNLRYLTQNIIHNKKSQRYEIDGRPRSLTADGYNAIIALATNGATQYQTLLNLTGNGIYFNQIKCTDRYNCWVTAEGVDKTGDVAYIIHTNDGWQTYDIQLTVQGGSLTTISMLTPTFGWAGGALLQSNSTSNGYDGQIWLTTDGATWTLNSQLKNFYAFHISTTSEQYAYASGITPVGLSSFASYDPRNN